MIKARIHFPAGFLWGTATSSHQVEGSQPDNDWSLWEQEEGRILHGHRAGLACDWWSGRWQEDLDRAAADGHNAHRLSLSWSRIEPEQGQWDENALHIYRNIIAGVRARGLTPMVTLHHFTNPRWVMDAGGWHNPEICKWFEAFTRKVVDRIGDLVSLWVTINEPNVYAFGAYLEGIFPPGEKNIRALPEVTEHLLRGHVAAYHAIHERYPQARVGLAHHYRSFRPMRRNSFLDASIASMKARFFNNLFPDAVADGVLSLFSRKAIPEAAGTQDFFGLNYYTRELSRFDLLHPASMLSLGEFAADAEVSPTGFIANEPAGMWEALAWAHRYRLPIYVTENGIEDDGDDLRRRYLARHIHQVWKAANMCWQVRGYFYWTLVDNFEWERGWTQRFGLYALDTRTQERTPRPSARFYTEICTANGLSSDVLREYAPGALEAIFPERGPDDLSG